MNPFSGLRRKKPIGFIYVADERQDPRFATATPGEVIRNATREPPWIIVEHTTDDILITSWPGMLWAAEVIDALEPQGHTGNYTRAVAVRLVRRLPLHELFGPHGEGVAWVADRAAALTRQDAGTLADNRAPEAGRLYSRAWLNWDGLPEDKRVYEDWEGVIGAGGGPPVSPVRRGLSAVFNTTVARAIELDGEAATIVEEGPEPDPDIHLVEPWATASLALIEAAMALGAPDLLAKDDRAVLTRPWAALTGPTLS